MINIAKSQPAPACLATEKAKKSSENYRCGEVVERCKNDFHNKCYLCEEATISSNHVEHFIPHAGNRDLMFDWNNLFFACEHCNSQKNILQNKKNFPILNCTNSEHRIVDRIRFGIRPLPKEKAIIEAQIPDEITQNTVKLLLKIYNGDNTSTKLSEAENIREKLVKEVATFEQYLRDYCFEKGLDEDDKRLMRNRVRRQLHPESPFTAFKIWIIKDNDYLRQEFSEYLNQTA